MSVSNAHYTCSCISYHRQLRVKCIRYTTSGPAKQVASAAANIRQSVEGWVHQESRPLTAYNNSTDISCVVWGCGWGCGWMLMLGFGVGKGVWRQGWGGVQASMFRLAIYDSCIILMNSCEQELMYFPGACATMMLIPCANISFNAYKWCLTPVLKSHRYISISMTSPGKREWGNSHTIHQGDN